MSAVHLPRAIHDEIIAHAREGKPEEICGILRGSAGRAFRLYRARNLAQDRIDNYDVDPQTLLKQFEFEEAGDEMVGDLPFPSGIGRLPVGHRCLECPLPGDLLPDLLAGVRRCAGDPGLSHGAGMARRRL